jgi:glucosamine-6-phosphate deaminase
MSGQRGLLPLRIRVLQNKMSLGQAAAERAAVNLRNAIKESGQARMIAATGASQFEFLDALTSAPDIDWARVEMFHLDEYVGLPATHPASFRKYLLERLIGKTGITRYHLLDPEDDPGEVVRRVGQELKSRPVDVAFVGIGENGHLAFNDPPANFETEEPYLIVNLDEACRRQQVNEGWFATLSEVPQQAISMSVRQILLAKEIIAVVPDSRKAQAVKSCCEGEISPLAPASILRTHQNTTIFLDNHSAALLSPEVRMRNCITGQSRGAT